MTLLDVWLLDLVRCMPILNLGYYVSKCCIFTKGYTHHFLWLIAQCYQCSWGHSKAQHCSIQTNPVFIFSLDISRGQCRQSTALFQQSQAQFSWFGSSRLVPSHLPDIIDIFWQDRQLSNISEFRLLISDTTKEICNFVKITLKSKYWLQQDKMGIK